MRVRLEVTKGPAAGKSWDFDEPEIFIFGRNPQAQCSIQSDVHISGNHFMLQLNPPDCILIDLNSTNGTTVNTTHYGVKEEKTPARCEWRLPGPVSLHHGDRIKAGITRFRVGIAYDLICQKCGAKFIVRGDEDLAKVRGGAVCQDCAGLDAARGSARRIRCARCGADATDEAGVRGVTGGVGYVCRKCRNSTIHDSGVREALRAGRGARVAFDGIDLDQGPPPPAVEGYELLKLLGVGGMGAVYLAREGHSGDLVAVKTLLPDVAVREEAAARFEREADITGSLRHPNIVRMRMRGRAGPVFYCVMDYVRGTDADNLMEACGGRVPRDEALDIMLQALDGLAFAH